MRNTGALVAPWRAFRKQAAVGRNLLTVWWLRTASPLVWNGVDGSGRGSTRNEERKVLWTGVDESCPPETRERGEESFVSLCGPCRRPGNQFVISSEFIVLSANPVIYTELCKYE